jgi:hypothetical protein
MEVGGEGARSNSAELVVRLMAITVSHTELRQFWSCLWAYGSVCLPLIRRKCVALDLGCVFLCFMPKCTYTHF